MTDRYTSKHYNILQKIQNMLLCIYCYCCCYVFIVLVGQLNWFPLIISYNKPSIGDCLRVPWKGKGWGVQRIAEIEGVPDSRNGYPWIEQATTTAVPRIPQAAGSRSTKERSQGHSFKLFLILEWQIEQTREFTVYNGKLSKVLNAWAKTKLRKIADRITVCRELSNTRSFQNWRKQKFQEPPLPGIFKARHKN